MNRRTIVYSDYQPLQYFMSQPKLQVKQQLQLAFLADFSIDVQYRPGKHNIFPDALSWQPALPADVHPCGDAFLSSMILEPSWLAKVYQGQQSDVSLSIFLKKAKSADNEFVLRQIYSLSLLYYHPKTEAYQLVIPDGKGLRQLLQEDAHCIPLAGHMGARKIISALQQQVWWPRLTLDVNTFIRSCLVCQRSKDSIQLPSGQLQPLPIPAERFSAWTMDFIIGLPMDCQFNAVFVCNDKLTKLVRLVPCASGGGEFSVEKTVQLFLDNIVRSYSIPKQVVHDRNSKFTSLFWKALFEILGSKLLYNLAYHPQMDRQTEQINKVVEYILRTMVTDVNAKWVCKLSFVESAINLLVNASTGKTPFELVYGQQVQNVVNQLDGLHYIEEAQQMVDNILKLMEETKTKLLQAKESQTKYHDKYHHSFKFPVNDKVLLSIQNLQLSGTWKFQQRFVGPLTLTECIGGQAYRLQLPETLQRFHNVLYVSLLKPYIAGGNRIEQPQPIVTNGEPEWEIETIFQHRNH